MTTFGCLIGAVVCLPFAGQLVHDAADAPLSATLNMVYLGVFPTALAFTTWAYALARTTAGQMGATTYAVPALVVLMSWLALGEVPGWSRSWAGCCAWPVWRCRGRARERPRWQRKLLLPLPPDRRRGPGDESGAAAREGLAARLLSVNAPCPQGP